MELRALANGFLFRRKPWYAGQFVRKIIPKIKLSENSVLFFTALLNKLKKRLLSVLVRDVDNMFLTSVVSLPIKNNKIDFAFIDKFIAELEAERLAELEAERLAELEAYLSVAGFKDYELTDEEQKVLKDYNCLPFKDFPVPTVFEVKNAGNILSEDIIEDSGEFPYLCASADNNAVSSYISYDKKYMDKGNCIFIGGKTFVVTYQEKDFFSNDSHNLTLRLKDETKRNKNIQLYVATCVNKSLGYKYSWGDSVSSKKIKNDIVSLPCSGKEIDYASMSILVSAIQKLVIKDVVLYADKKIETTKKAINKSQDYE